MKTPSRKKYVHKAMRWIGSPCAIEGGFISCNSRVFQFFVCCGASYEKTPTIEKAKSMKKGFSNLVEVSISGDDDVQQWWEILCVVKNVPDGVAKELIHYIIEHYIVVRGFAFAARLVELYKRNSKKKTCKSLKDFEKSYNLISYCYV